MNISNALSVLLVVCYTYASDDVALQQFAHLNDESILCRSCGTVASFSRYITSDKRSADSQYTFNDTLFEREQVVVQELLGDLFFNFPVVTILDSTCSGVGEWEESSWFPGYIARPCVCAECGTYLGWVFQPAHPKKDSETFFGFILTSLVGETFVDSLIVHPEN